MKVLDITSARESENTSKFLDINTIRSRVKRIKAGWNPDIAKARAIEGARRRQELEEIFLDILCDVSDSEESCDLAEHGFSLVG